MGGDWRSRVALVWAGICGLIVGVTSDTRYSWWIVGVLCTFNLTVGLVLRHRDRTMGGSGDG